MRLILIFVFQHLKTIYNTKICLLFIHKVEIFDNINTYILKTLDSIFGFLNILRSMYAMLKILESV